MPTPSTTVALGTPAPEFSLPDLGGTVRRRADYSGSPLLVMFLCNHCPYVKHVEGVLATIVAEYQARGLAAVAVMSNDRASQADDGPERLREQAARAGFTFPYLLDDERSSVGRAYRAACTPDFFLHDAEHRLAYRGRMDSSTPGNGQPNDGSELRAALDAVLSGRPVPEPHAPPMGCSIKWPDA
jgi:peroxiredoxin